MDKIFPCKDCGKETIDGPDFYMVEDYIWKKNVPEDKGTGEVFLCRDCLEKRMGRKLEPIDFANCQLNKENVAKYGSSAVRASYNVFTQNAEIVEVDDDQLCDFAKKVIGKLKEKIGEKETKKYIQSKGYDIDNIESDIRDDYKDGERFVDELCDFYFEKIGKDIVEEYAKVNKFETRVQGGIKVKAMPLPRLNNGPTFKDKDLTRTDSEVNKLLNASPYKDLLKKYITPDFNVSQFLELEEGLQDGLSEQQISRLADPAYTFEQMEEIKKWMLKGIDVLPYISDVVQPLQIREVGKAIESGLSESQINDISNIDLKWNQARDLRKRLTGSKEDIHFVMANVDKWGLQQGKCVPLPEVSPFPEILPQDMNVQASIVNGKVILDRNVIKGQDREKWKEQLTNYFKDEITKKQGQIALTTASGDTIVITDEKTLWKMLDEHNEKNKLEKLNDRQYKRKLRFAVHIDEIVQVSQVKKDESGNITKETDTKTHDFAQNGWTYPIVTVQDKSGITYKVKLNIGYTGEDAIGYCLTNIRAIKKDAGLIDFSTVKGYTKIATASLSTILYAYSYKKSTVNASIDWDEISNSTISDFLTAKQIVMPNPNVGRKGKIKFLEEQDLTNEFIAYMEDINKIRKKNHEEALKKAFEESQSQKKVGIQGEIEDLRERVEDFIKYDLVAFNEEDDDADLSEYDEKWEKLVYDFQTLCEKIAEKNGWEVSFEESNSIFAGRFISNYAKFTKYNDKENLEDEEEMGEAYLTMHSNNYHGEGLWFSSNVEGNYKAGVQANCVMAMAAKGKGIVQRFLALEPVDIQLDNGRIITVKWDEIGAKKNTYGINNSTPSGQNFKIRNIEKLPNYIMFAKHDGTRKEIGKDGVAHKGVEKWYYATVGIETDKGDYDLLINIRDKGNEQFFYEIEIKNRATACTRSASLCRHPISNNIIRDNSQKVNGDIKWDDELEKQYDKFASGNPLELKPKDKRVVKKYVADNYDVDDWRYFDLYEMLTTYAQEFKIESKEIIDINKILLRNRVENDKNNESFLRGKVKKLDLAKGKVFDIPSKTIRVEKLYGNYIIYDGVHRCAVAKEYGFEKIMANVIDLDKALEILHRKYEANVQAGCVMAMARIEKGIIYIDKDILEGVDKNKWKETVNDNLNTHTVTIANSDIKINKITRNEFMNSKYTISLKTSIYKDKLRITEDMDTVLRGATNWVNEGPKHERSDSFIGFARGNIKINILGNLYSADVVVGITSQDNLVLYDIVKLTFIKKASVHASIVGHRRYACSQFIIRNNSQKVNGSYDFGWHLSESEYNSFWDAFDYKKAEKAVETKGGDLGGTDHDICETLSELNLIKVKSANVPVDKLEHGDFYNAYYGDEETESLRKFLDENEDKQVFTVGEPIHVAFLAGRYMVMDGNHRLEAAKEGGFKTMECMVYDLSPFKGESVKVSANKKTDKALEVLRTIREMGYIAMLEDKQSTIIVSTMDKGFEEVDELMNSNGFGVVDEYQAGPYREKKYKMGKGVKGALQINESGDTELPPLPQEVLTQMGVENKKVILKQATLERQIKAHPELSMSQFSDILEKTLYSPDDIRKQGEDRWHLIKNNIRQSSKGKDIHGVSIVVNADIEIRVVHGHELNDYGVKKIQKKTTPSGPALPPSQASLSHGASPDFLTFEIVSILLYAKGGNKSMVAKINDTLNTSIFRGNKMKEEVENCLVEIANSVIGDMKKNDIPIEVADIQLVGSNANYNYGPKSDIDLHIIVNTKDIAGGLLTKLYEYFKAHWNDKHNIEIYNIPVELYFENANSLGKSAGRYSVLDSKWVEEPKKYEGEIPNIEEEYKEWKNDYDEDMKAIDKDGSEALKEWLTLIYLYRQQSLLVDGEFGVGNLVFKRLRDEGLIGEAKEKLRELEDKKLSL